MGKGEDQCNGNGHKESLINEISDLNTDFLLYS